MDPWTASTLQNGKLRHGGGGLGISPWQRGPLSWGLGLRTHCSEGRTEARQAWPGLGSWGEGQHRRGGHGERELLCLQEGDALLLVGGLIDEHGAHGGLPLMELVLAADQLEDGCTGPQRLKVPVLGGEQKVLGAEADLCPSPRRATPAGAAQEMSLTYGLAHSLLHFFRRCDRVSTEMPPGPVSGN